MKRPYLVSILSILLAACGGRSSLDDGTFGTLASPDSGGANSGNGTGATGNGGNGCPTDDPSCENGNGGSSSSGSTNPPSSDASAPGRTVDGGETDAARAGTGGDSGGMPRDAAVDAFTMPPVTCGNTSCARGEECCIRIAAGGTTSACIARGGACAPGVALTCTNGADCPTGDVCCLSVENGSATCETACAGGIFAGDLQLCSVRAPVSDCPAGDLCLNPPVGGLDLAICVPDFGTPLPVLGRTTR